MRWLKIFSDMPMDKQISAIVKSCFLQLRNFHHIHLFISKTAAITLANAFVHSHLDDCYRLLHSFPKYSIHCLQKIQTKTARIVTHTSLSSHIMPILKSLNWSPVKYRINFKICCLTHRALSLSEPYYLQSLLTNSFNSHSLRFSSFNSFVAPCFKKVYNGISSFSTIAPFHFNHLPNTIHSVHSYIF